ncbi:hypothetical protein L3Q82_021249 [Scortum barcoo]|uniref:Uncharacterized protein n=1 Tax=Scortum barcoo TaxID=214431 RepID=A0ACB8X545_9TELE|nr:hypothetical protein L3Q82_021249 [Scortum barcoo]
MECHLSWGGRSLSLCGRLRGTRLEIVGLTSTHSLGSGTQLLERGWTLHYSGVAQGERRRAGVGLLIAPQLSRHVLEFTRSTEYPAFLESLGGVLDSAPTGDSIVLLETSTLTWAASDTWRGVIGRNGLPDLNPKEEVGQTWQTQTRIVRVCWERLAEPSVREVFNSHLRKSFSQISREAGDIESEWTMFSASIVDLQLKLWTQGLWCLSWHGNPEPGGGHRKYRQAKQAAARTVLEAKTRVWEEFGEAMEEDYRSASKRFWQTVRRLRRGKQYSANTVYSAGGELLTSTGDIVGRWKKSTSRISSIPPTCLPSEEAEAGDSEVDSSITQAEVTEVVHKLLGGKAPGVDEIRPP